MENLPEKQYKITADAEYAKKCASYLVESADKLIDTLGALLLPEVAGDDT